MPIIKTMHWNENPNTFQLLIIDENGCAHAVQGVTDGGVSRKKAKLALAETIKTLNTEFDEKR